MVRKQWLNATSPPDLGSFTGNDGQNGQEMFGQTRDPECSRWHTPWLRHAEKAFRFTSSRANIVGGMGAEAEDWWGISDRDDKEIL